MDEYTLMNSPHENDRITDGLDIFFWIFNDESSYVATHWHSAIEIMYILDGEVDVTIYNQTTALLPGDVFLIDSAVPHATKSLSGNHAILIQLPYPLLKRYIPEIDSLNFSFDCHLNEPVFRTKLLKLTETIQQMQIIFDVNPEGGILRFNSLVFELMFQIYHNFRHTLPKNQSKKETKTFRRIEEILNYLDLHYNEPVSLSEISDIACFQKEYFCHFFKKNMGISFTTYLNEYRLSKIHQDLLNTDLPLKALLEKHGFTNYKLFRKMFYDAFQATPNEYRKKQLSARASKEKTTSQV